MDKKEIKGIVEKKLDDAQVPGAIVEMDPDEADFCGAFEEDAVSFQDALEAAEGTGDADYE